MKKILYTLWTLTVSSTLILQGQPRYEVSPTQFSTREHDEFCPVVHNGHIVYCSNQQIELLISFKNSDGKGLYNMFLVEIADSNDYSLPELFSRNLHSRFNDGPIAFVREGNQVVYSRNLDTRVRLRNMVDQTNNLGLFFAELKEGEWTNIKPFRYNDPEYSITTPCFSPDGQYLYFGSNMPGGMGGADIYRCRLSGGEWGKPENLGRTINTTGNEAYPFLPTMDQLVFASDGHGGLGKKDLYVSDHSESGWSDPVNLKAPINSPEDDFGLYTDEEFSQGYFSSNRNHSDDIFSFSTLIPRLFNCDTMRENYYCFEFWEEEYVESDTVPVSYEWEFSDGTRIEGLRVEHCLPGPGKHWAKFHIIDNTMDTTFRTESTMEFELEDHIQPYITCSEEILVNSDAPFSGMKSNLPGFKIEEYIWDFGDGSSMTGAEVQHRFIETGTYFVKLGLRGYYGDATVLTTRCVIKRVEVVSPLQQIE
jgi:hypothetical protein